MIRLLVIGGSGRLGSLVVHEANGDKAIRVVGSVQRDHRGGAQGVPVFTSLKAALEEVPSDVVLDVSDALGAAQRTEEVANSGRALVQGTTGLDEEGLAALETAGKRVAVVHAPNFSVGVVLLSRALRAVVGELDAGWNTAVLDRHHRGKRDAPSGTARVLKRGHPPDAAVASFRQGGVPGEHSVYLSTDDEELVLTHRALSRRLFATGALRAVSMAASSPPGLYTMEDVLFPNS